jgi:hypothetical protein
MNDSPELIVSFEVVPQSVAVYTTASGDKVTKVTLEHVIALDTNAKLWVRLVGNHEEVAPGTLQLWSCLNSQHNTPAKAHD